MKLQPIDSFRSFKLIEAQIEKAVKDGEMSREDAYRHLKKARNAYKNQDYNRELAKHAS